MTLTQSQLNIILRAKDEASANINKINRSIGQLEKTSEMAGKTTAAFLTVIVSSATAAVGSFMKLEEKISDVQTMTDMSFSKMQKSISDLSDKYGKDSKDLASALYDIVSAGYSGEEALKALESSTKGAIVGSSDVATTTAATLTIMRHYKELVKDTDQIQRIMFAGVKKGRITLNDLASDIGRPLNAAKAFGEELNTVMMTYAMGTQIFGGQSAEVATMLESVYEDLREKGDLVQKAGIKIYDSSGKFRGLLDVLEQINSAVAGKSTQEINDYMNNLGLTDRANSLLIGLVNNFDEYKQTIEDVGNSDFDEKLTEKLNKSYEVFNRLKTNAQNTFKNLGNTFSGKASEVMLKITEGIKRTNEWISKNEEFVRSFTGGVIKILAVSTALLFIPKVISLILSPVTWLIVGVALLASAWTLNWNGMRDILQNFWDKLKPVFSAIQEDIKNTWNILKETWGSEDLSFLDKLSLTFTNLSSLIISSLGSISLQFNEAFGGNNQQLITTIGKSVSELNTDWENLFKSISEKNIGEVIKNALNISGDIWKIPAKLLFSGFVNFDDENILSDLTTVLTNSAILSMVTGNVRLGFGLALTLDTVLGSNSILDIPFSFAGASLLTGSLKKGAFISAALSLVKVVMNDDISTAEKIKDLISVGVGGTLGFLVGGPLGSALGIQAALFFNDVITGTDLGKKIIYPIQTLINEVIMLLNKIPGVNFNFVADRNYLESLDKTSKLYGELSKIFNPSLNLNNIKDISDKPVQNNLYEKAIDKFQNSFIRDAFLSFTDSYKELNGQLEIVLKDSGKSMAETFINELKNSDLSVVLNGNLMEISGFSNGRVDSVLDRHGFISGSGTGTSDSILARVSNGEAIINANSTRKYKKILKLINEGNLKVPMFSGGTDYKNINLSELQKYGDLTGNMRSIFVYMAEHSEDTEAYSKLLSAFAGFSKNITDLTDQIKEAENEAKKTIEGLSGINNSSSFNSNNGKIINYFDAYLAYYKKEYILITKMADNFEKNFGGLGPKILDIASRTWKAKQKEVYNPQTKEKEIKTVGLDFNFGFVDQIVDQILKLENVLKILDFMGTIFDSLFSVIGPLINSSLQPFVNILQALGQMIGTLLVPLMTPLFAGIQAIGSILTWLYNTILVPIGQGIYFIFGLASNAFNMLYNTVSAVIKGITLGAVNIGNRSVKAMAEIAKEAGEKIQKIDIENVQNSENAYNNEYSSTVQRTGPENVYYTFNINANDSFVFDSMEKFKELIYKLIKDYEKETGMKFA